MFEPRSATGSPSARLRGRGEPPGGLPLPSETRLIGQSPGIRAVVRQVERIAPSDAPVLIQGETGSGKQLAARAVHQASARRNAPFVAINCSAFPDRLIETALFGCARGAFTDARESRTGLVARAQRGTLFLDEIETLSPKAQAALSRFLQDHRYRPLGSLTEIAADVRIIAASNQPLQAAVDDGQFRSDLLYRLSTLALRIPPLRSRPEDVEPLALHFIQRFSSHYGIAPKRLGISALEWLRRQGWPGNVRELENWIHRELLLAEGDEISCTGETQLPDRGSLSRSSDFRTAKARALAEFEATYLTRVLAETHGNVTAAARRAGKERRAFGKLLKKHGIDKTRYQS